MNPKISFLLLWFMLSLSPYLATSKNSNNDSSIFPIRNLQASLTASEGQATIVALKIDEDSVIIVSLSQNTNSKYPTRSLKSSGTSNELALSENNEVRLEEVPFAIPVNRRGAVPRFYQNGKNENMKVKKTESKTIHLLHENVGICLAMTGFASDVNHLVRYVANAVAEHEYLYGGEVPSIHSLARNTLAPHMREATIFGGSRPFGVQGMLVGNERCSPQVFTADPSGIFRHCLSGVASIGRNAESVKKSILKALHDDNNNDGTKSKRSQVQQIMHYLDITIKSMLENMIDVYDLSDPNFELSKQFDVVIVLGGKDCKKSLKCAVLNHEYISRSCSRSRDAIVSEDKLKKI